MVKGFIYTDYLPEMADFYRDMGGWIAAGKIVSPRDGPRRDRSDARRPFSTCSPGANMGKMLVRL